MKEMITVPDLVKQINRFTGELLTKLSKDGSDENIVFSPYSVFTLLLLAADSSAGKTRNEIVDAVLNNHDFGQSLGLLKKYIQPDLSEEGQFSAANAIIVREDKKDSITPGYPEHIRKVFDAELFVGKDIIKAVNDWVYEKSSGMIPSIVDDSMKDMLLCLLNACTFTAGWQMQYEPESIQYKDFHNRDGSASRMAMLKSRESKYIENDWFIGFEKPYAGYEFSYVVLLPKEHNQFPGTALNAVDFSACFSGRANASVNVTMPEFRITSDYNLTDICKELGINTIFTPDADLTPMSSEWLMAEVIRHKAHIEVNRKGTKAAAATAMRFPIGGMPKMLPDIKNVVVDRPFLYAIVHSGTGLPVFAGIVNHLDPVMEPESF